MSTNSEQTKKFLTPAELGARWSQHEETIRRKLRRSELPSIVIGRRRLIPIEAVENVEKGGLPNGSCPNEEFFLTAKERSKKAAVREHHSRNMTISEIVCPKK